VYIDLIKGQLPDHALRGAIRGEGGGTLSFTFFLLEFE